MGSCSWLIFDWLLDVKVDFHLPYCTQDNIINRLNGLNNFVTVF